MLFECCAGIFDGVLLDLVLSGEDLVAGEAGLSHFEDFAAGGIFDLLANETFGEVPVGGGGDLFEELSAGFLALSEGELPLDGGGDFGAEFFFGVEADFGEEFGVDFREDVLFDFGDIEAGVYGFAAHFDDGRFEGDGDGGFAGIADADALHEVAEAIEDGIGEVQRGEQANGFGLEFADDVVVVCEGDLAEHEVAGGGGFFGGAEVSVSGEEVFEAGCEVSGRGISGGASDGEVGEVWEVEGGSDFDIELVAEVAVFGDDEVIDVESGFADGFDVVVAGDLFEAGDEYFLFDVGFDFFAELFAEQ